MRYTKQRQIIFEELKKVKTHPRVDEIYDMVRQRLPRISLGTVYRNLDLMARQGTVLELSAGDFNCYDGNASAHSHFLCRHCRRMWDFDMEPRWIERKAGRLGAGFRVEEKYIIYRGLCPQCAGDAEREIGK